MNRPRIFTAAALAMIMAAVALAGVGHFVHALIVLGSVVVGGLFLAWLGTRS